MPVHRALPARSVQPALGRLPGPVTVSKSSMVVKADNNAQYVSHDCLQVRFFLDERWSQSAVQLVSVDEVVLCSPACAYLG